MKGEAQGKHNGGKPHYIIVVYFWKGWKFWGVGCWFLCFGSVTLRSRAEVNEVPRIQNLRRHHPETCLHRECLSCLTQGPAPRAGHFPFLNSSSITRMKGMRITASAVEGCEAWTRRSRGSTWHRAGSHSTLRMPAIVLTQSKALCYVPSLQQRMLWAGCSCLFKIHMLKSKLRVWWQ